MGAVSPAIWIVVGVFVLLVVWLVMTYNGLVSARTNTKNAWSQIDVQLKRRYDLIPNLVETVKGYAKHEKELLENIAKARSACLGAQGIGQLAQAETQLTAGLRSLLAVIENYPDLKANENFRSLMEELTSTENKIGFARQFYNDLVAQFNLRQETFPSNIVAGLFAFKPAEYFQLDSPEERKAVKVSF